MMTIFDPRKNMFTLYDPVNSESRGVDINEIRSSQLDYACFLLYNGGELITESVTRVDKGTMERIKESIHLLPEYNRNTYQALTEIASEVPEIPCFLLCETAFFTRLPSEVAAYAVPAFLKDKGMKRFGGHGLFHEYILQELKAHDNHSTKIISIYLGNYPHMAAIRDGLPIETTIGFSSLEGLMSVDGCGDIDPTIIFELYSKGMPFNEINILLSQKSGFSGLSGGVCDFKRLLTENDTEMSKVRRIFTYNVVRYIGAFIAVLGGVDCITFSYGNTEPAEDLIADILGCFNFLNIKTAISGKLKEYRKISTADSSVDVFCISYDRLKMIHKLVTIFLEGVFYG